MADKQVNIIVKAVDAVTGELRKIGDGVDSFASKVKGVFVALGAAIAAIGLGKLFRDSITEALEAEKSMARLDAALRPLGRSYKDVAVEVEKYLDNIQRTTRYSDEEAREALTKLVIATGSYELALKDMPITINLAAAANKSLVEAADMVTKAHVGVARELKNFGIQVKAGVDAVPQLTAKLGDWEKTSRTMGDRLGTVNNLWKEFKELIGAALIGSEQLSASGGAVDRIVDLLVRMAEWVDKNADKIEKFADTIIRFGIDAGGTLLTVLGQIRDAWVGFRDWNERLVASITESIGLMVIGFAKAVEAIGGPILKFFGITVVDGLRAKGEAMVRDSHVVLTALRDKHKEKFDEIGKVVEEGEDKKTGIVFGANVRRGQITADALRSQAAAEKAYQKELADTAELLYKTQLVAVQGFYGDYLRATAPFWKQVTELQAAALKAGKEGAQETQVALDALGRAALAAGKLVADHSLKLDDMRVKHDQLKSPLAQTVTLTDDLRGEFEGLTPAEIRETIAAKESAAAHEARRLAIQRDTQEVSAAVWKMAEFTHALRGISPALDEFADKMEGLASGVSNIANGIGRIASGDVIGGIGQGISGIVGLVSMFTGESESSRRVRIALEQAREAIQHNTRALGDLGETDTAGRVVAGIKSGLESFFASFQRSTMTPYLTASQESQLSGALSARGVSLADLESLARDYGVTLRPQGTGIHAGLLKEFLKLVGGLDTGIPTDFGSQLRQIQDNARLRGDSSQQLLDAILGLVTGPYGSPFLASAFAGKSPQQILSALPGIAQNRGAVGAAGLGGLNLAQFDQVINLLADTIRSIAAPSGGVPALPPLPMPTLPPMGNPLGGMTLTPITPVLLPTSSGGGSNTVNSTIESITVNVAPTEWNPQEIAKAVGVSVDFVLQTQALAIERMLADNYVTAQQSAGNVELT